MACCTNPQAWRVRPTLLGLLLLVGGGCTTAAQRAQGRPWIHKVYLDGVKQVKAGELRDKIAVQQSPWFPLAPKRYLDHPYAVEVDRARIEAFYQSHGYFAAKVRKAEVLPYKDKPAVDIRFTIEEGQPTLLSKVQVVGLPPSKPTDRAPPDKVALTVGQPFEHQPYLVAKEVMLNRLRVRGHAFAEVTGEVAVNRDERTAEVTITAQPGPMTKIGVARIAGSSTVDMPALIRYAVIPTGLTYTPSFLESIQAKLYNLGIFSTVLVEPVAREGEPKIADVRISLADGKLRELRAGLGFGIESQRTEVHGELAFTQRRFLGGLRTLQLGLLPGFASIPAFWANPISRSGPMLSVKADFTQPDLLGENSALTWSLIYDLGIDYAYQYHGPGTRLGITKSFLRDRLKLAASYNFQLLSFFNTDPVILSDPGAAGALYGFVDPYRLGYLQEQIVYDRRDRSIDARRGFLIGLLAEQSGKYTGSAFDYQKILPELRGYWTFFNRLTVAARLQFGQMFVQNELGSPITQRFYLGGPSSHRGFSYNRLSYQVCSGRVGEAKYPAKLDCQIAAMTEGISDFRRLPIGGDQMLLGQLELRVSLFKLAGNWLSLAAFSDVGDVTAPASGSCGDKACEPVPYPKALDLSKLHLAVGGGIRYRTVIGTIRFDLGVRLNRLEVTEADGTENPDPGSRIAYHFSIGEAF